MFFVLFSIILFQIIHISPQHEPGRIILEIFVEKGVSGFDLSVTRNFGAEGHFNVMLGFGDRSFEGKDVLLAVGLASTFG
jgi:hypothetical protein